MTEATMHTSRIEMTPAELAYGISLIDPDGTSPIPGIIGLTPADMTDDMRTAGRSSLAVRGLLVSEGEMLELAPAPGAVVTGLARPRAAVQIGLIAHDSVDSALFLDAGPVRLTVGARMLRTYEFTGLDGAMPLGAQVLSVARGFLGEHRPGVVAVDATTFATSDAPTPTVAKGSIAVSAAGAWSFSTDADLDAPIPMASEADGWAAFEDVLNRGGAPTR